jgi:hypothetical protein
MDSQRRGARTRSRTTTADRPAAPPALESVDHDRFPDVATRRAIDRGRASQRFRDLLAEGGPILADGAMGTTLFAN